MTYGSNGNSKGIIDVVQDGVVVLTFRDSSLNFYKSDAVKEQLREIMNLHISNGHTKFVLDLENVKVIDSTGLGAGFIVPNNVANAHQCKLAFVNVRPFIERILEIVRIRKHLQLFPTIDEALENLS